MSVADSIEVELKFDVDADLPIPDLSGLVDGAVVDEPVVHHLEATYYDTADTVLARNRITLRRRIGGADAGWHLKRPTTEADTRRETTAGHTDAEVPEELRRHVLAIIRRSRLIPVATIATHRTVSTVRDRDGVSLGELCEDVVTAESLLPGGTVTAWTEWEFELTGGSARTLKAARRALRAAGAREASTASKLARTIGSDAAAPQTPQTTQTPRTPRMPKKPTALDLVRFDLAAHRDAFVALDPAARSDAPDAVHRMRVATRKIRSILTWYPTVLDGATTEPVAEELRLLAQILGEVRDREGRLAANRALLAREDAPEELREVLIDRELRAHEQALKAMRYALSTDRYLSLLDAVDALVDAPAAGPDADRPAAEVAAAAVESAQRRLVKAQKRLRSLPRWSPEWVEQAHTVRKRAKAARYTAESAAPLRRKSFARIASHAKTIQRHLGDFNDTVVNRDHLAVAAADPSLSRTAIFVLGRMDAREERRGRRAVDKFLRTSREH